MAECSTLRFGPRGQFPAKPPTAHDSLEADDSWLPLSQRFVYRNGKRYSTADGSLRTSDRSREPGVDLLGEFIRDKEYLTADGVKLQASVRSYLRTPLKIYGMVSHSCILIIYNMYMCVFLRYNGEFTYTLYYQTGNPTCT